MHSISRTEIVAIDMDRFDETVFEKVIDEAFTRIPCYEKSLDNILGVIYLKDLLLKARKGEEIIPKNIMRPVMMVSEFQKIGQLMKDFQLKHQQMAVVVDEYGGTRGIITMEDILEELVGEIQDEFDNETLTVEKIDDKNFTVQASAFIEDINNLLPHPIKKDEDYESLAGKLTHQFGQIPNTNDKIIFDDYEITILKKSRNSIVLVKVRDLVE